MRGLIVTLALVSIVATFCFVCVKKEPVPETAATPEAAPEAAVEPVPETLAAPETPATLEEAPAEEEEPYYEEPATAEEAPPEEEEPYYEEPATAEPGTGEVPEVEPTEDDYDKALSAALAKMERRPVEFYFDWPEEIKIYETKTVKFTTKLAEEEETEPIKKLIDTAQGKKWVEIGIIKTTSVIVAELLPVNYNFEVEPEGEKEQYLGPDGICCWEWNITAQKRGRQKLQLRIGYRIYDPRGTERTTYRPTLHREVTVKVEDNWMEYFWREYWKVVTGVLGAISLFLGIILSLKKLLKRKEKGKEAD